MSETEQREQELVAGVIEGVTQKRPDTWQVAVKPEGSQYTKNLWTKDQALVSALTAKLGQAGSFVCNASYWTNQSGAQVRSLWIAGEGSEGAAPSPSLPQTAASSGSSDVDWDAKERRDYRSRAYAQAVSALAHTYEREESLESYHRRLRALSRMIYVDVVRELDPDAHPDDDIPFA